MKAAVNRRATLKLIAAAGATAATSGAACLDWSRHDSAAGAGPRGAAAPAPTSAQTSGQGAAKKPAGADAILSVNLMGFPWQTLDPFLFCVHHDDRYPRRQRSPGPGRLAGRPRPRAATSRARTAGACTTARRCPGFPQHPHRGFETVTIVRRGPARPLRLAGRRGALRRRRRAVADRGQRHRARRDVPAARPQGGQPAGAVPDLAEPAQRPTSWSTRTSRCSGTATIPRQVARDAERQRHRGHRGRRAATATSTAPPPPPNSWASRARYRRRHLDHPHGARARAGRCRRRGPAPTARCTSSGAADCASAGRPSRTATRVDAAGRRRRGAGERARRRPSCCCCRAPDRRAGGAVRARS